MAYRPQVLSVANGGTGLTTLTAHALQIGNGTSSPTQLSGANSTILIGSSASNPSFSATPTVTSITFGSGNALDTYVTNSFTPSLVLATPGTSSFTYSIQIGRYSQIGTAVLFTARIVLTNFTIGSGSGDVRLTGLPVASANVANQSFQCVANLQNMTFGASVLWYTGNIDPGVSYINFPGNIASSSTLNLDASNLSNTSVFIVSGWYSTA